MLVGLGHSRAQPVVGYNDTARGTIFNDSSCFAWFIWRLLLNIPFWITVDQEIKITRIRDTLNLSPSSSEYVDMDEFVDLLPFKMS